MITFPKDFCDTEEDGFLPAWWDGAGEVHEYYMIQVGIACFDFQTLNSAVYHICELIKEAKENELSYLPIGFCKYICDEGFCSPKEKATIFYSEEEFYTWIQKFLLTNN